MLLEHHRVDAGSSERKSTWTPATYVAGRFSSHWPGPPSRRAVAVAEARIARRERTTCLGVPVEPEVSMTSGSGSVGAACHSESSAYTRGGAAHGSKAAHEGQRYA